MDVDDVEAAGLELAAQPLEPGRRERQVRDGAVGGNPDGAAERDHVLRELALLRTGTAMQTLAASVGRIEGRKHAHVMPRS